MAAIRPPRDGTATSPMTRRRRAASITSRIWRRPDPSPGISASRIACWCCGRAMGCRFAPNRMRRAWPPPSLRAAAEAIIEGYAGGTRFGIGADADGLIKAGVPGVQLTWMDARVGDWVVTPRIGKPVEVQALWLNALRIAGAWSSRWAALEEKAHAAFLARFPDPASGGLYDVV